MSQNETDEQTDKLSAHLLLLAALIGLLLAVLAALPQMSQPLVNDGIVVRVNDRHIDRTEYARAYKALLDDKRKAPTQADKKLALDRLIEEELLVQRGLEIGLIDGDTNVRKAVASAVIEFVLAQNGTAAASALDLQNFYQANKARFTPAARLQVERIFVRQFDGTGNKLVDDETIAQKLDNIRTALRNGQNFTHVATMMGDDILPPLPRIMLVRNKMYDYLGTQLTDMAAQLPAGAISDAIADGAGWHFLRIVRNQPARAPEFATIQPQIEAAFSRQRDDASLRDYLNWLKKRANIIYAEDAPQ